MLFLLTALCGGAEPSNDRRSVRLERKPEKPGRKIRMDRQTTNPIRYELVNVPEGKAVVTVNAYYPEAIAQIFAMRRRTGSFGTKTERWSPWMS